MRLPLIAALTLLSLLCAAPAIAGDAAVFLELPFRYVIGGRSAQSWLNSAQAGSRVRPGTSFNLYSLNGGEGQITTGKASPDQHVCPDVWLVDIDPEVDTHAIAVRAPWNPMPRTAKMASLMQEVYLKAVAEILASQGINHPKVRITQHLRVDLDGDGEEEVLLSATHYPKEDGVSEAEEIPPTSESAGSYSFVALRRVLKGKVSTQILAGEFYPESRVFNAPSAYEVGGLLDLDGDGTLEIILHSNYYEGDSTMVWQLGPRKATQVLEISCGL